MTIANRDIPGINKLQYPQAPASNYRPDYLRPKRPSSCCRLLTACASIAFACSPISPQNIIPSLHAEAIPLQYIGECWMEADGTIRMFLRAESHTKSGTIVGHTVQEYRPGDPNYRMILDHVGPMRPGDRKPVPAWPD
jgi:hypothetical protein